MGGIGHGARVAVNDDFELAVQCHRAGMLDKAAKLCRKVLLKKPKHAQALHLLGLMAHQQNHPAEAAEWHGKAVAAKPDFAQAHNGQAAALFASLGSVPAVSHSCTLPAPSAARAANIEHRTSNVQHRTSKSLGSVPAVSHFYTLPAPSIAPRVVEASRRNVMGFRLLLRDAATTALQSDRPII